MERSTHLFITFINLNGLYWAPYKRVALLKHTDLGYLKAINVIGVDCVESEHKGGVVSLWEIGVPQSFIEKKLFQSEA